jgi:hypothetical protein
LHGEGPVSPDFRDLLSAFNAHRVEYLVVGAHALAAHGHVRATGDLDGRAQDIADVESLEKLRKP